MPRSDYTPQLGHRHVLMLSDYVSEGYDEIDKQHEDEMISQIKNQMKDWKIPFSFEEIKSVNEMKDVLKKYPPQNTVVFNWCEEIYNDPGKPYMIPEILDSLGYIYTGPNKNQMIKLESKNYIKDILSKMYIPTPRFLILHNFETIKNDIKGFNKFPAIVKSLEEHGSAGLTYDSIVENEEELIREADKALSHFSGGILVEEFIKGDELAISVWGNASPEVLPLFQIKYEEGYNGKYQIQNYASKWDRNSIEFNTTKAIPFPVTKKEEMVIKEVAIQAYKALGCVDFVRMEMRYLNKMPYIIDVNDNPCFLPNTSFLLAANKAGYTYAQAVGKICEFALVRAGIVQ